MSNEACKHLEIYIGKVSKWLTFCEETNIFKAGLGMEQSIDIISSDVEQKTAAAAAEAITKVLIQH